jgi:uncharacterized protein (TIGR00255 family)
MKSMTGYGAGSAAFPGGRVSVELRAVNHRFLELKTILPRDFLPWEKDLRELVEAQLKRGKIDLTLTFSGKPPGTYTVQLNLDLARAYQDALTRLQHELGLRGEADLNLLATHSELFQISEKPQPTTVEVEAAKQALQRALTTLERQRLREGKFLQRDLQTRVSTLGKIRRLVKERSATTQQVQREKLRERVTGLLKGMEVDQSRLLQEVVTLTQKSDITEELVRLDSHLEALSSLLRTHEPVGKRIDFLLQEIQREINTIGAKADDAAIRHLVVEAKEEVEKLREQVQNVE